MTESPNPRLIDQLVSMYERSAERLRQIVLHPSGNLSAPYNQTRAQTLLNEVQAEIQRLKAGAAHWTGQAITESTHQGITLAQQQIDSIRVGKSLEASIPQDSGLKTQDWSHVNHDALRLLAPDTVRDLDIAADGLGKLAKGTLNQLSGLGVTPKEVNDILAGRLTGAGRGGSLGTQYRELRDKLQAVNGKKVVIPCKDGIDREYDTSYYAEMISRTKTRQAIVEAKHQQFAAEGIDLVKIVGRISPHFCTSYLNHIYSISGTSKKYPALADLRVSGVEAPGPPFHPNCSKSSIPYITGADEFSQRIAARIAAQKEAA